MQRSTFKVLFYVKRQSEKSGQVPIMGRITINGTMSQFSCKLTVRSSLWDAKANKASGKSLEAQRINEKLENIKTNIGKQYQRLCDRDSYVTAEKIRNASLGMGDDCRLLLQTDNYKRLWAEDAEKIRRLGVKIKNLEAAARHEVEIAGPIDAAVRDTVVIRDTVPILRQKVEMITPHIRLTRLIENERLKGEIRVPVTLRQAVWVEYKGWWFWKRAKAVHQTIVGDNPYVDIRYSEYIRIE